MDRSIIESTAQDPAAGGLLGINAKSASGGKLARFALQAGGRELMPDERVAKCLRVPHGQAVDVLYVPEHQTACYRGLQTCGSVWMCPVCAAKISERRRVELSQALAAWREQGGRVLLATYTIRHKLADDLAVSLDAMLYARKLCRSGRWAAGFTERIGLAGSVRALEVTHSKANGWHPHMHELLFVAASTTAGEVDAYLRPRWSDVLKSAGLREVNHHGLEVTDCDERIAEYVAKWGREPVWTEEHELAKQVTKRGRGASRTPTDLLAAYAFDQDDQAGALWQQYAAVFKGRRQLSWSRGLRALLGLAVEQTDEEIAAETSETAVLLASLTLAQWRHIVANDARGEVLAVAASGDRLALWRFLAELGVPGAAQAAAGDHPAERARAAGGISGAAAGLRD